MKKMRDIESFILQNLELDSKKNRNVRNVIFKEKNYEIRNFLGLDSKGNIESKILNKGKLENIESRFYKNIEISNLDSKKVIESNLQNFVKLDSKNVDSKKSDVDISLTLNMTNNLDSKEKLENIESKAIKNVDCHENSCEFSRNDNSKDSIKSIESRKVALDSKNLKKIESKKANLDSKNKRIKTSSDSLTFNGDVRSTQPCEPARFAVLKSGKNLAVVRDSTFQQKSGLAGLAPFKTKKRLLFFAKGARGGGFALVYRFASLRRAMCKNQSHNDILKNSDTRKLDSTESKNVLLNNKDIEKVESKNILLKNSDFRKLDSIESKNVEFIRNNKNIESNDKDSTKTQNLDSIKLTDFNNNKKSRYFASLNMTKNTESRFYKSIEIDNLDSIKNNAHLPTPLAPLRKGGGNITTQHLKHKRDLENIESKNMDSKKINVDVSLTLNMTKLDLKENLENIESRFYESIEIDNLDSIKLENVESNILNYKGFSPCESALDSMSHPYPPIENLSQIHRAKIQVQQDSKKLESIESNNLDSKKVTKMKTKKRIYANTQSGRKDSNIISETIIVTESSLKDSKDSKNIESNLQNLEITESITLDSKNSILSPTHHPVFDKESNLQNLEITESITINQNSSIESNSQDSNNLSPTRHPTFNKNTQIDYVESIPLDEYKPKESHNKPLLEVKNIEISFKDFAKKDSIFNIFKRKKHKNNAIESRDENHARNIESKSIESNNKTKESKDSNENIESNNKTNAQNIESKNKNTKQILKNINFDIKEHEFVSVIGDSGCGKSTLLKILAGFLKPNSGEVLFQNKIHNKPNADISVMFQTPTLYPWLTLSKNIAFSAKLKHKSAKEQQEIAQKYIKMVGLKEQEKNYPYQCSGGMQSRAYLAQVLACESKLILMDEPFAALDAFTKRSMQDLVLLLYKRLKSSVFFITHDIEEALYLSNRIFIMKPLSSSIESNIIEILNIDMDRQNRDEFERSKEFLQLKEYLYARVKERYDYVI